MIFRLALAGAAACSAAPSSAILFSAGFTDFTLLASAPSSAAVYGFAYPGSAGAAPSLSLTLTRADGSVAAQVAAAPALSGVGTDCDGSCYAAGYLSGVGTTSCCQAWTCPQGCAIGGVVPTLDACLAQCSNASGCAYTVPGTSLELDSCGGCLTGCPGKGECEAGCGFRFRAPANQPVAWKALLPPQPAGGDYSLTVACSNCAAGTAPSLTLQHIAFGSVFYCSGQSNMALAVQYTYSYEALVAEVEAGELDDLRYFNFGGMGLQSDAPSPAYATTALNYPAWGWQNLSMGHAVKDGFQALSNVPATCLYFLYSLKRSGVAGPLGMIANAVGGTTIAAWSHPDDLAACPNSTDTASAAPPLVLYNGMAAPLFNYTVSGWVWYQSENDAGNPSGPGNSMGGGAGATGYGCALPKMIARYRAAWSATPGTTDPLAPFGIVTLAANTNEGSGQHVGGLRWSQTGNYGVLPNPIMPATFLAQGFDIGDPWQMYDADGHNCSKPYNGRYGPGCVEPWTDLGAWDPLMRALAPSIRNDTTPSFMGGIHPRIKPPVGWRLAQAFVNQFAGGTAPYTGPTITGCSVGAGSITVFYNASLLRGEAVLVQPFDTDTSKWGVRDSATFMVCFSSMGGGDCLASDERHLGLWLPAAAVAGGDGASATLTLPPPPAAGGTLAALRYGWPLSNEGDTCCPFINVTRGLQVCIPGNCPIKTARSFLPGNPFYANITAAGKCACLFPQECGV